MATYEAGVLAAISGTECHIEPLKVLPSQTAHTMRVPRRDSFFLVLAPITSSDYPSTPVSRASSLASVEAKTPTALTGSTIDTTTTVDALSQIKKERRSSSTSTSSSSYGSFKRRFLKLGPVHNGGDPGVSDYVDFEEE